MWRMYEQARYPSCQLTNSDKALKKTQSTDGDPSH